MLIQYIFQSDLLLYPYSNYTLKTELDYKRFSRHYSIIYQLCACVCSLLMPDSFLSLQNSITNLNHNLVQMFLLPQRPP